MDLKNPGIFQVKIKEKSPGKMSKDDYSSKTSKISNCALELFTLQICFKLECQVRFYKTSTYCTCNIC